MSCGGKNMWANNDQFRFLWKKIKGDFIISATVRFIGKGVDPHRKIGIIARNELTADSPYADACCSWRWLDLSSIQACRYCTNRTDRFAIERSCQYRITT